MMLQSDALCVQVVRVFSRGGGGALLDCWLPLHDWPETQPQSINFRPNFPSSKIP